MSTRLEKMLMRLSSLCFRNFGFTTISPFRRETRQIYCMCIFVRQGLVMLNWNIRSKYVLQGQIIRFKV